MARPVAGESLAELVRGIGPEGKIALLVEDLISQNQVGEDRPRRELELAHVACL